MREITLVYGHCIDSITVVYDRNGKPVKAETHGGRGGDHTAEVRFDPCTLSFNRQLSSIRFELRISSNKVETDANRANGHRLQSSYFKIR